MFSRNRVVYNLCRRSVVRYEKGLSQINLKTLAPAVNNVQQSTIHNVAKKVAVKKDDVRATNKFVQRTHTCGELTADDVGEKVQLFGWLQYNRMGKFLILRDAYGLTQCIIPEERKDLWDLVKDISYESVLKITGTVVLRPENQRQDQTPTGTIEVSVDSLEISNSSSEPLPFNIRNFLKPTEFTGMKHRYLVLRFPEMQNNLRVRSWVIAKMREYLLNQCDFIEVETPTLFRRTPGGAHEFLVPTKSPNKYYCLTQSPQQLKQLLMIGGIDRYFQVARCYRDETSRNDRQPEFTQMDIELSFTDKKGVQALMEGVIKHSWPEHLGDLEIPFPRMSYDQVMEIYGSENPDLTIPYQINNITEIMALSKDLLEKSNFKSDDVFRSYALVIPNGEKNLTKSVQTKLSALAQQNYKKARLIQLKISDKMDRLIDLFSEPVAIDLFNKLKLNNGDLLFVTYGNIRHAQSLIGKVRVEFTNAMESSGNYVRSKEFKFLWVDDFPLFEPTDDGVLVSAHHPFTRPHHDDMQHLSTDPTKVRGLQYDLVLNGSEIAGGSIRIHEHDLQQKMLQMLNIDPTSLEYFLNALKFGAPPHGGIAIGLDRYISILCRAHSIRDVIAFPKTIDGNDLMTGAPSDISEQERAMYHLKKTGTN